MNCKLTEMTLSVWCLRARVCQSGFPVPLDISNEVRLAGGISQGGFPGAGNYKTLFMSAASFVEIKLARLRCLTTASFTARRELLLRFGVMRLSDQTKYIFPRIGGTRQDSAIDPYLDAFLIEVSCPRETIRAVISVRFIGFTR